MPLAPVGRVGDDILQQRMRTPAAHQVRHGRQHSTRHKGLAQPADEQMAVGARENPRENPLCGLGRKHRTVRVQVKVKILEWPEV
jgi:hypothetical protein